MIHSCYGVFKYRAVAAERIIFAARQFLPHPMVVPTQWDAREAALVKAFEEYDKP